MERSFILTLALLDAFDAALGKIDAAVKELVKKKKEIATQSPLEAAKFMWRTATR